MEPKDKQVVDVETPEIDVQKEEQIQSMESAIARLQSLTKSNSNAQLHKAEIPTKEEVIAENKQMDLEYNLSENELDPNFEDINEVLSEEDDARHNKRFAWLAYILFFIPLLINKKSPFVRLHANEGLDVFIIDMFATALTVCGKVIPFSATWSIIGDLMFLAGLGLFALTTVTKIFQIVRVLMGKKNQTPWLWKTRIIK